jgi:hypothetical protein
VQGTVTVLGYCDSKEDCLYSIDRKLEGLYTASDLQTDF